MSWVFKTLLALFFLTMTTWAQDREVGAYSRKSVTYVDALWLIDSSVRNLSKSDIRELLNSIHKHLKMGRFDYNPVPESYMQEFISEANRVSLSGEGSLDVLSEIMKRTLVAKIVEAIDIEKEMRAANLLTEQQQNSFITDKAKLLGITEAELQSVMNSAFIYLPVIKNYRSSRSQEDVDVHLDVGIIWFKLELKPEGGMNVIPLIREWTSVQSSASANSYNYRGARKYAFSKMADLAGKNLKVATQAYDDFKLSGQVLDASLLNAGLDVGSNEGVKVNNTYLLVEKIQDAKGNIKEEEIGFGIIDEVSSTEDLAGSQLYIVSGTPDIGTEIKEYPLMGLELHIGGRKFIHSLEAPSFKIKESYGPEFTTLYHIGDAFQWFYEMGLAIGFGSVEEIENSEPYVESFLFGAIKLGLSKRFFLYRRLAMRLSAGGIMVGLNLNLNPQQDVEDQSYIYNYNFGVYTEANLEFVVSPSFKLAGGVRYHALPKSEDYYDSDQELVKFNAINWSGLNIGLYISYTPKSLFIDPADFMANGFGF